MRESEHAEHEARPTQEVCPFNTDARFGGRERQLLGSTAAPTHPRDLAGSSGLIFGFISFVAGVFGFTNIASGARGIAQIVFFVAVAICLVVLIFGVTFGVLVF
jgi:uncharacterized membrane protein YtjA (UPF0391 family)